MSIDDLTDTTPWTQATAETIAAACHNRRPDWDLAGITAQLRKAHAAGKTPLQTHLACVKAARNERMGTPFEIGNMASSAWSTEPVQLRPRNATASTACGICGKDRETCEAVAAAVPVERHEFVPFREDVRRRSTKVSDHVARLKAVPKARPATADAA